MTKPKLPVVLEDIFQYINKNVDTYLQRLREAVEIPSVSASPEHRPDIFKMINWMSEKLENVGCKTEICDIGMQTLSDEETIQLPPVLLGTLGSDPKKKTVLIYGHLDVQPASKDDWNTDPFKLVEIDGKLFGRGSSDDKGPCIGCVNAVEAYQVLNYELPINIKFVFEGMEECGSAGLEDFLKKRDDFLKDVDCVCITDARWMGTKTPCLIYGLRGNCYFKVEVECAKNDLHSGIHGGATHEAMTDLVHLLNSLTDSSGNILIPGIYDSVKEITDEEMQLYKNIDFNLETFKESAGCKQLLQTDKMDVLMKTWRYPSLSLHGIEGCGSTLRTAIPRKVIGKFSIRIVPNQDPDEIINLVISYLDKQWKSLNSPNKYKTVVSMGAKPWLSSVSHYNYKAAFNATKHAYNKEPDMTRIGSSIPITLTFQELTGKNVLVLPIGSGDDGAHSQNEKINVANYITGSKQIAAYFYELGQSK